MPDFRSTCIQCNCILQNQPKMRRMQEHGRSSVSPLIGPTVLRVLLALLQGMAICLTWHLWEVRTTEGDAPNLPLIDAAWMDRLQFGWGWLLLISLVFAV